MAKDGAAKETKSGTIANAIPRLHGWVREIDYLRGFAVLAVLMLHTNTCSFEIDGLNFLSFSNLFIGIYMLVAVPLFILISGFVLHATYNGGFSLLSFYRKRLVILPPYIIFSVIYMLFSYAIPNPHSHLINTTPITVDYVARLLLESQAYGHMWFFSVLIQLYLLYPLLNKIYRFFEKKGLLGAMVIGSLLLQVAWNLAMAPRGGKVPILNTNLFLEVLFYFVLGMFAAKNLDKIKSLCNGFSIPALFSVSLVLNAACILPLAAGLKYYHNLSQIPEPYKYGAYFLGPILFALIFALFYRISVLLAGWRGPLSRFMLSIGRLSFGIYLIHMIFEAVAVKYLAINGIDFNSWLLYPIIFVAEAALSYISIYAISLMPHSEWIIGSGSFRKMKASQDTA
jgi:surface polysaccharide O-acyltransferase-like enzyme